MPTDVKYTYFVRFEVRHKTETLVPTGVLDLNFLIEYKSDIDKAQKCIEETFHYFNVRLLDWKLLLGYKRPDEDGSYEAASSSSYLPDTKVALELAFNVWLVELDKISKIKGLENYIVHPEDFRPFFNEFKSPADTFRICSM